jgi:hypothetical protein
MTTPSRQVFIKMSFCQNLGMTGVIPCFLSYYYIYYYYLGLVIYIKRQYPKYTRIVAPRSAIKKSSFVVKTTQHLEPQGLQLLHQCFFR